MPPQIAPVLKVDTRLLMPLPVKFEAASAEEIKASPLLSAIVKFLDSAD